MKTATGARVVSTVDKTLKTQKPYDGLLLMGLPCLPTDRPTVHRRYDVKQRNYPCRSFQSHSSYRP